MYCRSRVFLLALLIASFGFVGCSGLVSGNIGNAPPPTLAITNIQAASITTSSSQIVWATNVPANSSVDYGTTTAYGSSTPVDSTMVTSHQMTLSGLAAGTTYYYQVNSTDNKGNNGHGGNKFKSAGFTLSGTITPTAAGNGATVALSGPASASATADSSGNYAFAGLANGSYMVTPNHTGYAFTPGNQSAMVNGTNVSGVNFTATAAPVMPTITTQPASQTVTAGQAASFSVAATGTAPLSYQWNRNGAVISGATSSSYTTPVTTSSDNGAQFTVVVTNVAGSATSNAATLTVTAAPVAPSITTQPTSHTVTAGQTASFSVAATGTAPLSYQWQKNGASIAGATLSIYTTPAATTSDSGSTFAVVVTNTAGTVTSSAATLTVNAAPVAPSIATQPASQTVTAGQTATFTVVAGGTAPLSYQWQKNAVNIAGATAASYKTPATTTTDSGSTFRVVVTNTAGTVTSSAATLTVNAAPVAPSITTQPASQTVTAAQTATFSVTATGAAPLSYQWSRNGAAISGATSSSYTTPATTSSDNGALFTVVVSNTAGSVTSSAAALTVNPAPVAPSITTQPSSQTVTAGQTASFNVVATGSAPLSYQWQKNGASIAGATSSSYTTPATTASDSGSTFAVVVTNTAGTVTSSAATLTVNAGGTIINVTAYGATGNGSTDDTVAINSAIAALQPGYELFFPCGTYQISSGLNAITLNNVTIAGQTGCGGGTVAIRGTGGGSTILQVGASQSLTSPTAITATTADMDLTFQANFSAIGAGVGDYVLLTESVSSTDTSHSNCGGSGCRGEVLKITGLSGNTATVETAVHNVYDLNDVPWVQKVLNPVSGVTVQNLLLDGSGAAMYALAVLNAVNLNANNLTLQNVSCSAVAAVNGYNDAYSTITITHAGTNSGCNIGGSAVSLQQQGNLNVNGMSISNMNVGAFGFIPFREANGTFSNISVDGTGTGSGRLFKTNSAAHNVFNNISTNRDEGAYYQGITIEYFSHHNVWNSCKVTNNISSDGSIGSNNGINLYGDVSNGNNQGSNHYNTFNNCTVTGNNGSAILISDNNNNIEINGGTYSGVAGQPVIDFDDYSPCCTNNAYVHNVTITGPGTTGINIANGSTNACINNNTFGPGLSTAINVTASSDIGSGNLLNGLSSNLTPGSCGPPLP